MPRALLDEASGWLTVLSDYMALPTSFEVSLIFPNIFEYKQAGDEAADWGLPHPVNGSIVSVRSFLFSVRTELANIGPKIVALFVVLDAWKNHLGTRNRRPRVGDIFFKRFLIPGDA